MSLNIPLPRSTMEKLQQEERANRINLFDWASLNWNGCKIECLEKGIIEFGRRKIAYSANYTQFFYFLRQFPLKREGRKVKGAEEINNVNFHEFFFFPTDFPMQWASEESEQDDLLVWFESVTKEKQQKPEVK